MSNDIENLELKLGMTEIMKGYTAGSTVNFKTFYLKHVDFEITTSVNVELIKHTKDLKSKNYPTNKEKLKELVELDRWSSGKDSDIDNQRKYLEGLRLTKSKVILKAQIESIKAQIIEAEKKLNEMEAERKEIFGLTQEEYINRRSNELYIYYSIYKDNNFNELYFTKSEFDELDDKELNEILSEYDDMTKRLSSLNLKKIAVMPFFMNNFILCDDNPMIYYGKPITQLSYNQIELFSNGRHFKNILSKMGPETSFEYQNDPEKLIELFESRESAEKIIKKMDKDNNKNISFVGATQEDLERLGMTGPGQNTINLNKAAKKKGGNLSFKEIIELQEGK